MTDSELLACGNCGRSDYFYQESKVRDTGDVPSPGLLLETFRLWLTRADDGSVTVLDTADFTYEPVAGDISEVPEDDSVFVALGCSKCGAVAETLDELVCTICDEGADHVICNNCEFNGLVSRHPEELSDICPKCAGDGYLRFAHVS